MNTKKILVLALAAVLLVAVTVAGTVAYLTAKTDPVTNTFTTADINITLTEENKGPFKLVPGTTYAKDPVATVLAGSEPCYLYVEVLATNTKDFISYEVASDWLIMTGVEGPNGGQMYYYNSVVDASKADVAKYILAGGTNGQVTVLDTVTDEMLTENFTEPTLKFWAYAIQSTNTGTAAEAWADLMTQDFPTAN